MSDKEIQVEEQRFKDYLVSKGLKLTPERQTIFRRVFDTHKHFEAEDLLLSLRQDHQRVSKATIYRTLTLLVKSGHLREVIFGEKHSHYEHVHGNEHHDHLICSGCDKIMEFKDETIESLQDEVCAKFRFKPESHRMQIHGLCEDCQKAGVEV